MISNKNGFTLIELIFSILLIGILSAVAIPKFAGLKDNAEVKAIIKVVKDAESSLAPSAVNLIDVQSKSDTVLSDMISIKTKKSEYDSTGGGTYKILAKDDSVIASIAFDDANRTFTSKIDCDSFSTTSTQDVCKSLVVQPYDNTFGF